MYMKLLNRKKKTSISMLCKKGVFGASTHNECSGPKVIKLFSCSTQLSMKFSQLINMKMPTIVGIFIFISREIFMLSYV